MSKHLINKYLNELASLKKVSGEHREGIVSEAFKTLLKDWGAASGLVFVPQYKVKTKAKENRYVDGAVLHALRIPLGYWEAKDTDDALDLEIAKKLKIGYPNTNIIFENSAEAVLWQDGAEVLRCAIDDVVRLEKLLDLFFDHQPPEIAVWREAVKQFNTDLPEVLADLREMIDTAFSESATFRKASKKFLEHARETINPSVSDADVREMLIQHILTEDIFASVFQESDFHRNNNIAKELYGLEASFFSGDLKKRTLRGLQPYYAAIRGAASKIESHKEKQTFVKVIYEGFYRIYNPKAADRLGVVYTPNEIVRFMVESADWLCEKYFDKSLIESGVEILDPATGTGTFICELLEHFRGQPTRLKYKYARELHANEVAILPYYVANLNIEATYAAITDQYDEFQNLCFVDTLDNVGKHTAQVGVQLGLLAGMSAENVVRVKRQNSKKISVIIGNPPYNANQQNENDDNKNREYDEIDARISDTYIKRSSAQKTKLYDMYARFFRWASDRLDENGIIAFVSNNSFIDKRTFDGFRLCLARDFSEIRVINLKGDARTSGEVRRREGGNVFNDQIRVGVAVWFCVRKKGAKGCRIYYEAVKDYASGAEKQDFLRAATIADRKFTEIRPDAKGNWINQANNDFDSLVPVASKTTKASKKPTDQRAIFGLFSLGVSTNRDEWLYDYDEKTLAKKVQFLIKGYESHAPKSVQFNTTIKWSETLKRRASSGAREPFDARRIVRAAYRPYCAPAFYHSEVFVDRSAAGVFPDPDTENRCIIVSGPAAQKPWLVCAVNRVPDLHFVGAAAGAICLPIFRYNDGVASANITEWAVKQFRDHYKTAAKSAPGKIAKEAIFHYVYAVLHDPVYRRKYALNLKRELPRVPFYAEFWQWSEWGKQLMDLHLGYEKVKPWKLIRTDVLDVKARDAEQAPKVLLRADKENGIIHIDSETTLSGVPKAAWMYELGNLCALEWVLDQYGESRPRDPTILKRFDTYRFENYKDAVLDLLRRVTTVSVQTQEIIAAMVATGKR